MNRFVRSIKILMITRIKLKTHANEVWGQQTSLPNGPDDSTQVSPSQTTMMLMMPFYQMRGEQLKSARITQIEAQSLQLDKPHQNREDYWLAWIAARRWNSLTHHLGVESKQEMFAIDRARVRVRKREKKVRELDPTVSQILTRLLCFNFTHTHKLAVILDRVQTTLTDWLIISFLLTQFFLYNSISHRHRNVK